MSAGPTEAVVDLRAFRANLDHIRRVIAPARLMVVLKADAYGHGRLRMARAAVAAGITDLGALDLDTALALRAGGIGEQVRLLAWLYPPEEDFAAAAEARVDLGVSSVEEVRRIAAAAGSVASRLHLKIDTGLNRNGARAEDWPALVRAALEAQAAGSVEVHGVWTHIAEASEEDDTIALQRFEHAVREAEALGARFAVRHLAASSAGLRRADVRFEMVRMGGHCWGIPSFDGVTPREIGLEPVLTLRSEVSAIRTGADGGPRAVVPAGYAQGVPVVAAGRVSVSVRGRRRPVLEVHRDRIEIGLDGADGGDVRRGDPVVLFGTGDSGEQTVREWGDAIGTLGDEIVTRIPARVPRRYVD